MHRTSFSKQDADEIRGVLREKSEAPRDEQRIYRNTLRNNFDFYISDFGTFRPNGMTAEDFDDLVESRVITINEQ